MALPQTPRDTLIDACLADLGHLVRCAEAETLTEDVFRDLTRRLRANLKAVKRQDEDQAELFHIELTDAGLEALRRPAELPRLPEGTRARRVGRLAVIDGDGAPQPTKGA